MDEQLDMFPDIEKTRRKVPKDYGEFTDKFKTKLTTDDCYTPEPVYNAVRDWCVEKYGLQGREIVRPFWPGGDFETYDYPEGCVVIDNPPFSIYDKILKFYLENGIDFFLFGPALTLFKKYDCCYVIANETVTYGNGAKVNTSFATSLDPNRVVCYTELNGRIHEANDGNRQKYKENPVLVYPDNLVTSAILGKTSRVDFAFGREDTAWISKVNGERIFGSGFILSDRAAADRAAARKRIVREFGPEELEILKRLNNKD